MNEHSNAAMINNTRRAVVKRGSAASKLVLGRRAHNQPTRSVMKGVLIFADGTSCKPSKRKALGPELSHVLSPGPFSPVFRILSATRTKVL